MKEVSIEVLRQGTRPGDLILHPSGVVLLDADEPFSEPLVDLFEQVHLPYVIIPEEWESLNDVRFKLLFTVLQPSDLKPGHVLSNPIYDQHNRLLLEAGSKITELFCQSLERRGATEILIRKELVYTPTEGETMRKAVESALELQHISPNMNLGKAAEILANLVTHSASQSQFSPDQLKAQIDLLEQVDYQAKGVEFATMIRDTRSKPATEKEKSALSDLTRDSLILCREVFAWFSKAAIGQQSTRGPLSSINQIASNIMAGVIQHKDIMALCAVHSESEDYLPAHSLAVATVACLIGTRLKFGAAQIKSLTFGGLLADVGLVRVPKMILSKPGPLDEYERARVKAHPSIGLDLLAVIKDLPPEVPWIVFQSHERSDGSGYPCGKSGRVIHVLAKIVGVADLFVAMCAPRPYRDAHLPYNAMETLLRMASRKEFDADIVRAILEAQSLFPIGSMIQLEDGRVARVVASNPEAYTRPVIVVLSDLSYERINLLDHSEIKVAKPLPNPKEFKLKDKLVGL